MAVRGWTLFMGGAGYFRTRNYGDQAKFALAGDPNGSVEELKDLCNGESQMVKALPKIAKAATSEELRAGFEEHLEQAGAARRPA